MTFGFLVRKSENGNRLFEIGWSVNTPSYLWIGKYIFQKAYVKLLLVKSVSYVYQIIPAAIWSLKLYMVFSYSLPILGYQVYMVINFLHLSWAE